MSAGTQLWTPTEALAVGEHKSLSCLNAAVVQHSCTVSVSWYDAQWKVCAVNSRRDQFKMLCLLSINQPLPPHPPLPTPTNHQHPDSVSTLQFLSETLPILGMAKTNVALSVRRRRKRHYTFTHTQSQRLERRPCLGFLLLEQRFMVGGSCRESLRLNYTDGEHQVQEQLPRLWGGWRGRDESGSRGRRYGSRAWAHLYQLLLRAHLY